jgi:hypothetical protein
VEKDMENLAVPHVNPKNADYPEIITVTDTNEKTEATEEHKLLYESGVPKGTILVKKTSVTHTTIRTTTPYTGTV